jgi:ELWxxDGT repeat protein
VETAPLHAYGGEILGSFLYFEDSVSLSKTDGTTTTQIESFSGSGGPVAVVGSSLFYVDGGKLMVTDGTPNVASEISNTTQLPNPANLIAVGSTLFFTTTPTGNTSAVSLWKVNSDGSNLVNLGTNLPNVANFASAGSTLFFTTAPSPTGSAGSLWSVNSTEASALSVTAGNVQFYYGRATEQPVGSTLYFLTSDGASGTGLWASDGTAAGTLLLRDFPTVPSSLSAVGSKLFFSAEDGVHGYQPWLSDGTPAGTAFVKSLSTGTDGSSPGADPVYTNGGLDINGTMYFSAYPGSGVGDDLWKTDGTSAGTTRVAAGVSHLMSGGGVYDTIDPTTLYNIGGHLVFESSDIAPGGPDELWTSDGTASGTGPLANVAVSVEGNDGLIQAGDVWYFVAGALGASSSLWITDGTAAGTHQVLPVAGPANIFGSLVPLAGKLLFLTYDQTSNDVELWRSDGTAAGTAVVKDLGTWATSGSPQLQTTGNRLFITSYTGAPSPGPLWISDGTATGTVLLASSIDTTENGLDFVPVSGGFVFGVVDNTSRSEQLWFTDGTAAGTKQVVDLSTAAVSFPQYDFTVLGSQVIFVAQTSSTSDTLWASDGTVSGTHALGTFTTLTDAGDALPPFVALNGKLYFGADDGTHGKQLWVTDGTAAGTMAITNINSTETAGGLDPENLRAINGLLFFSGNDGVHGAEPWLSNGTAAGTSMIQDTDPGPAGSAPYNFTAFGSQVFFVADDGTQGDEPWILTPQATQALLATGGHTLNATVGATISNKTLATFTDPNGNLAAGQYQASVNWGDSTNPSNGNVSGPDVNGVFTVTGTHTYLLQTTTADTITVVVTRQGSANATATDSANVADAPLSVTAKTLSAQVGTALSGTIATFTDPGGAQTLTDYSATVDWGDGKGVVPATVNGPDANGVFTVSGSVTYTSPGADTATITVHHTGVSPDVVAHDSVTVSGPVSFNSTGGAVSVTVANGNLEIVAGSNVVSSTPLADVTSVTVNGAAGIANSFTLDYSGGTFIVPGGITFNGGTLPATPSNSLTIVGGSFDTATLNFATAHNGSIQLGTGGQVVNYSNMTPLAITGTAANAVVQLPNGTVVATLDTAGIGMVRLVSGNGAFETTTFAAPTGSLTVNAGTGTATVTPTASFYNTFQANLTVNGAANTLALRGVGAGTLTATEGNLLTHAVATFSDPNGAGAAGSYSANIDWGDGKGAVPATVSGPDAKGNFTVTGANTYAEEQTAGAMATVVLHRAGATDVTITDIVQLADAPLTGKAASVTATTQATFSGVVATFTDGNPAAAAGDFTANINWGDGSMGPGTVSSANGGFQVTGSHLYAAGGAENIVVTVNDLGGQSASITSSATVVAGGTPHERYVAAVYEDVLGRAPDPNGLTYWAKLLDQGAAVASVAEEIAHSAEYYGNFVIAPAYLSLLGRAADTDGTQFWVKQMQGGLTDQQLEAGFAASDEFYANAGGNDKAWVDAVYKLLLGRPAESSGETFWTGQLASGQTRLQVAEGIARSAENDTQLINADYQHYLGRPSDASGLSFWLQQFASGATNEDVISEFTGSAEYYGDHTS